LQSVSIFSQLALNKILNNENIYKKTPFLFILASYSRNKAIEWADENLRYVQKAEKGSWMIYCFEYI